MGRLGLAVIRHGAPVEGIHSGAILSSMGLHDILLQALMEGLSQYRMYPSAPCTLTCSQHLTQADRELCWASLLQASLCGDLHAP